MVSTDGAKVASIPIRRPLPIASRNIASLGFSTGTGSSRDMRSIAGPNAEQVTRIASAPMRCA